MIKPIMHDPIFLARPSVPAVPEDLHVAQIIQHKIDHCNGVLI